jgi:hypothetical protein
MEITEALLAVAQIALGLAGFSAVLVALSGEPNRWTPLDSFRITGMLTLSFGALFLSLAPLVLGFFSVSESVLWRVSAALLALFNFGGGMTTFGRFRRLSLSDRMALNPSLVYANQVVLSLLALLQVAAAAGFVGATPGVVFLGLVALLGFAAFMVVRFLFARPAA